MSRFVQSVGTQLSLALLLVVAVALGVVYLTVVPSLRDRAINTRVAGMEKIAGKLRPQVDLAWAEDNGVVATQSEENGGVRILRRGYNYTDGQDPVTGKLAAGLFFIAFQRDPGEECDDSPECPFRLIDAALGRCDDERER